MDRPRRTSVKSYDKNDTKMAVKVDDEESDVPLSDKKLLVEQKQPQNNFTTKKSENLRSDNSGNITEMSFEIDAKKS